MSGLSRALRYKVSFSIGMLLAVVACATVIILIWPRAPLWTFVVLGFVLAVIEDLLPLIRRRAGAS